MIMHKTSGYRVSTEASHLELIDYSPWVRHQDNSNITAAQEMHIILPIIGQKAQISYPPIAT